uniref:Uncharacterized protein LOC114340171 n=1 Tax=Diabrotica virgifera virgifera TaxID=50390 RepID=A0A6P7GL86_DIAVI
MSKTDVCHKCEVLKMELTITNDEENKNTLKEQQAKHHEEADLAYTCKSKAKKLAMEDHSVLCYTFDLQQCLPTPFLETSVSFCKRKYWTYNLTIHNCGNGFASCYFMARVDSNERSKRNCFVFFKELMNLPPEVKKVIW